MHTNIFINDKTIFMIKIRTLRHNEKYNDFKNINSYHSLSIEAYRLLQIYFIFYDYVYALTFLIT